MSLQDEWAKTRDRVIMLPEEEDLVLFDAQEAGSTGGIASKKSVDAMITEQGKIFTRVIAKASIGGMECASQPPRFFAFAPELWRHRGLFWKYTRRTIELRHRGSHLGLVWTVLNPLLTLALYVFIFGYIFNGSFRVLPNETKLDYALTLFLGLAIYQFISEVLVVSPLAVVGNPNLVKKVVFPLEILPASLVGSAVYHTSVSLVLVLIGVAVLGPGLDAGAVWLPVILLPLIPLALGLAWFLAALGVFLRDINQIIGLVSMALMYASVIFFPISSIPAKIWLLLRLNPLLLTVQLARDAILWHRPLNMAYLFYVAIFSIVTCALGYVFFKRTATAFADVL